MVEKEEHGDAGEDARSDQLADWIDAKSSHGIDLFGNNHGPEFAGNRGGVPAGNHDAGEHGAEFADHGEAYKLSGYGGGAEGRERGGRLKRQHAAGGDS